MACWSAKASGYSHRPTSSGTERRALPARRSPPTYLSPHTTWTSTPPSPLIERGRETTASTSSGTEAEVSNGQPRALQHACSGRSSKALSAPKLSAAATPKQADRRKPKEPACRQETARRCASAPVRSEGVGSPGARAYEDCQPLGEQAHRGIKAGPERVDRIAGSAKCTSASIRPVASASSAGIRRKGERDRLLHRPARA